jgi:hypothetical protein
VILADTGFWIALANQKDRHHARAKAAAARVTGPFVATWPVLTETCHLMMRLGVDAEIRFVEAAARGALKIFDLRPAHLARVIELLHKYRDLPMDLADASLVVAAEELGSGRILSTDERDFRTYRWKNHKPFTNVL